MFLCLSISLHSIAKSSAFNFPSIAIHADLPQEERIKLFDLFKEFLGKICVTNEIWIVFLLLEKPFF